MGEGRPEPKAGAGSGVASQPRDNSLSIPAPQASTLPYGQGNQSLGEIRGQGPRRKLAETMQAQCSSNVFVQWECGGLSSALPSGPSILPGKLAFGLEPGSTLDSFPRTCLQLLVHSFGHLTGY